MSTSKGEAGGAASGGEPAKDTSARPKRIGIPGFISEEIGLGDVIKRATSSMGIKPCGGCLRRAQALNAWVVFTPRGR